MEVNSKHDKVKNGDAAGAGHKTKNSKPRNKLTEKVFEPRNSLLTDLFEIKHFATIYRIFLVILISMFLNRIITDFLTEGKLDFGLKPVFVGFRGLHIALGIWILMQSVTLIVFPVFKLWANSTTKYFDSPSNSFRKVWNIFWVSLVVLYQVTFLVQFTKIINSFDMGPASTMAAIIELTRFMMKSHAFIRTNAGRILTNHGKHDDKENKTQTPTFEMYLYFLFAPTLLYRDQYPRTQQKTNWGFVLQNLLEIFGIIYLLSFLFEKYFIPQYKDFGKSENESFSYIILTTLNFTIPGLLCMVCGFYLVLHCWLNATSEIIKFADRMFYKDWWNSTNYANYYRTWNIVVHEWLYYYIYKDFYEHVFKQNVFLSQLMVFAVSVLFHEYIVGFTVRFFYPVMVFMFGCIGVPCSLIWKERSSFGNLFIWFSIGCGMGIMISLYMIEHFARINCKTINESDDWWNVLIPNSWRC